MMRLMLAGGLFSLILVSSAGADDLTRVNYYSDLGSCLTPIETFPYKLDRNDPLYETALEDHQRYLEEMEDYVNCLERERGAALVELRTSFNLFMQNFGKDAVLKYAAERKEAGR